MFEYTLIIVYINVTPKSNKKQFFNKKNCEKQQNLSET